MPARPTDADVDGAQSRNKRRIVESWLATGAFALLAASALLLLGFGAWLIFDGDVAKGVGFCVTMTAALGAASVKVVEFWAKVQDHKQLAKELGPIWIAGHGVSSNSEVWRNYQRLCFPPEKK